MEHSREDTSNFRKGIVVGVLFITAVYSLVHWALPGFLGFTSKKPQTIDPSQILPYVAGLPDWISRGFWPLDMIVLALILIPLIAYLNAALEKKETENIFLFCAAFIGSMGAPFTIGLLGWFTGTQALVIGVVVILTFGVVLLALIRGFEWVLIRVANAVGNITKSAWNAFTTKTSVGRALYNWFEATDKPAATSESPSDPS